MGNDFFDSFKKLWGDNDDEKEGENKKGGEIAEHDDVAAGTSIIASISGEFCYVQAVYCKQSTWPILNFLHQ